MRIQVNANGIISVDGEVRQVDVSDLDPEIEAIYFDTERSLGIIQYFDNILVDMQVRDFDAEREAEAYAREHNLKAPEEPLYKTVKVPKPNREFTTYNTIQTWHERWQAAPPPPPPPEIPPEVLEESERLRQDREQAADDQVLAGSPVTFRDLRQMNRAQARAWWDANVTTAANRDRILRWVFLYIVRRF